MTDTTDPIPPGLPSEVVQSLLASELADDSGFNLEIDLRGFPSDEELLKASEALEDGASGEKPAPTPVELAQHLSRLLEPYSLESVNKAHDLLRRSMVQTAKEEGQQAWYNVVGSKLYVVHITRGDDFLYAECSCPNGQHRGGDAICYHSIAARVKNAGLVGTWLD